MASFWLEVSSSNVNVSNSSTIVCCVAAQRLLSISNCSQFQTLSPHLTACTWLVEQCAAGQKWQQQQQWQQQHRTKNTVQVKQSRMLCVVHSRRMSTTRMLLQVGSRLASDPSCCSQVWLLQRRRALWITLSLHRLSSCPCSEHVAKCNTPTGGKGCQERTYLLQCTLHGLYCSAQRHTAVDLNLVLLCCCHCCQRSSTAQRLL
jgi:hypothetical protein